MKNHHIAKIRPHPKGPAKLNRTVILLDCNVEKTVQDSQLTFCCPFHETPGGATIVGGLIVFVAVAVHLVVGAPQKVRAT